MPEPLLTRRTVVLAKIESSFNVDALPVPTLDAILVAEPDYAVEVNMLERDFTRSDIDSLPGRPGRKIATMTFTHEWRSNGKTSSGVVGDACKLGLLLRGCGFAQSTVSVGTGQIGAVNAEDTNTGPTVTWTAAGAGAAGLTQPTLFTFQVTLGGASGTAQVSITPDAQSVAAGIATVRTAQVVTTGTAITLITGLTIAPAWTGSLVLGDKFYVWIFPVGFTYRPVSAAFESLTLYMYKDGILHKMTGAVGTFSIQAEAGGDAKAQFTFTGQYVTPTDATLPTTAKLENNLPAIVELADLYLQGLPASAAAFSIDVGNDVSPRMNVNNADGYEGSRITRRNVTGSMDPEMVTVATFNFWNQMAAGDLLLFRAKVGQTAGNRIWSIGQNVQMGALTYGDREQILTIETPLMFTRKFGNDSLVVCIS